MTSRLSLLFLFAANILIPIAILTFATGFFPYKPFLSGLAEVEDLSEYGRTSSLPDAPFDKVIFMVVDALRSDFVYSNVSGFDFTQSLISSGAAIPFTAHATSPTITMPRIKAITTGSVPSFLDVILNFAESDTTSTLATQDTWLAQMKAKGTGKMVMYGDDTWLKLFPDFFDRADGTSSFFVSDFTEVDNNVTRHIPEELRNDDWNTMILHYLGLDHIGHKAGPKSPNMIPKQHEMDGIVSQIYKAMETKEHLGSTLLILLGDHGMNDAGNHGGSAPGETSPALVFIAPKLINITSRLETPAPYQEDYQYYSTVEQSDIAPTLGALLGFPVPKNNLGSLIPEFLPLWTQKSNKIDIMLRNARQILKVVTTTFPSFEEAGSLEHCADSPSDIEDLACQWRSITTSYEDLETGDVDAWIESVIKWLKQAQEMMSSTASNYDVSRLASGQAAAALSLLLALAAASPTISKYFKSCSPILLISLLYGIMMFASSYVEEEQHFWYWATTAWLAVLWIKCAQKEELNACILALTSIAILLATRVTRRWNQTGQKFTGEPDIAGTFFFAHRSVLWYLVGITYLWNLQSLASRAFPKLSQLAGGALACVIATASLTFKLAFTQEDSPELMAGLAKMMVDDSGFSLVSRARIVFALLAIITVYTLVSGLNNKRPNPTMRALHDLLTLLLITQSRATNIPLLLIFEMQAYLISSLPLSQIEITTTSLLLQYASFFAFGGSNTISSIDLSSAYNGVSGYNVLAVGILTFISNWTGPIFWVSATNLLLVRLYKINRGGGGEGAGVAGGSGENEEKAVLFPHLALMTVFVSSSLFFVMGACTVLRTHLFIWTVFSPKYLYSMAWSIGQHLGINIGLGSLLFWLGTKYA